MRKKDCCIFDNSPLSPVPYIQKRENTKDSKIELTETVFFSFLFLTPPFVSKIEIVIEKVNKSDAHSLTCSEHRRNASSETPSGNLPESELLDNASESCSIANVPLLTSISLLLSQASFTFLEKRGTKQIVT
jgi:hypothetical protein